MPNSRPTVPGGPTGVVVYVLGTGRNVMGPRSNRLPCGRDWSRPTPLKSKDLQRKDLGKTTTSNLLPPSHSPVWTVTTYPP